MSLADVKLDLRPGASKILVNGQDVASCCRRVVVVAGASPDERIAVVHLELNAEVEITGEGVVQAARDPESVDEAVSEFLETINPEELEALAMSKLGPFSGQSTAAAFLDAMKELVNGNDDRT